MRTELRVFRLICHAVYASSLICVAYFTLGCSDKGSNPSSVRDVIYIYGAATRSILILDADSFSVVDSIPQIGVGGESVEDMVVTPDGKWLFTSGEGSSTQENRVRKIDTRTGETVGEISTKERGRLLLLNSGKLLRWGYCAGLQSQVNQFPTWTPDTSDICVQNGPVSGMVVAGGVSGTNHIRIEEANPRNTLAEFVARRLDGTEVMSVHFVALHPGHARVSAIVRDSLGRGWFIVMDVPSEATVYEHALTQIPGWFFPGEVAISGSGAVAVVTDPGKPWFDYYVGTIDIVDLDNLSLLKRFDNSDFDGPQSNSQIAFCSDESAVIVTSIDHGLGAIYRIDLSSLSIAKSGFLPDDPVVGGMAVGPSTVSR